MLSSLTAGLLLGLAAGLSPGPLLTMVISQSLNHGIKEGVKVAFSPLLTDAPIILSTMLLILVLENNPWPLGWLSCAGALYVLRLAGESLTLKPLEEKQPPTATASLRRGVIVNLLNPHPYLFWFTVGTPLMTKTWAVSPWGAVLWIAGFYSMLVGSKIALAVLAGRSRAHLTPEILRWVHRLLGIALIVFALLLLRDGLRLLGIG